MNTKISNTDGAQGVASLPPRTGSAIWRTPVKVNEWNNPGAHLHWAVGGGKTIILDCGHDVRRKQSQATPKKVRCLECEGLRSGTRQTIWPHDDGTETAEVWNAETQMPERIKRKSVSLLIDNGGVTGKFNSCLKSPKLSISK